MVRVSLWNYWSIRYDLTWFVRIFYPDFNGELCVIVSGLSYYVQVEDGAGNLNRLPVAGSYYEITASDISKPSLDLHDFIVCVEVVGIPFVAPVDVGESGLGYFF